ncbi:hypothetical protein Tco_1079513 [Tanacetum coccineum]|uniref:Uncharacterized protein n=1 Tax=Tanacetum coccineum TaxID=301880 RepID=A0ABQ5HU27_9ASTR
MDVVVSDSQWAQTAGAGTLCVFEGQTLEALALCSARVLAVPTMREEGLSAAFWVDRFMDWLGMNRLRCGHCEGEEWRRDASCLSVCEREFVRRERVPVLVACGSQRKEGERGAGSTSIESWGVRCKERRTGWGAVERCVRSGVMESARSESGEDGGGQACWGVKVRGLGGAEGGWLCFRRCVFEKSHALKVLVRRARFWVWDWWEKRDALVERNGVRACASVGAWDWVCGGIVLCGGSGGVESDGVVDVVRKSWRREREGGRGGEWVVAGVAREEMGDGGRVERERLDGGGRWCEREEGSGSLWKRGRAAGGQSGERGWEERAVVVGAREREGLMELCGVSVWVWGAGGVCVWCAFGDERLCWAVREMVVSEKRETGEGGWEKGRG